jgi:hypothetical protein
VKIGFTDCGATFDPTRRYRYTLWRYWKEQPERFVNFVMLNPSTADETALDPTVTRCMNFAHHWGYDGAYVTNIFALRSTDPKALYGHPDPVGTENDVNILMTAERCKLVIAAWGVHGRLNGRGMEVAELLQPWDLQCFALTKEGFPRHPLYLRKDSTPVPFVVPAVRTA